ncbi:hypothetical protein LTR09_004807 [Extremus antarcticus]|uniref:Thioredoxin domain-containing protein n=1 Tax=Extremus antarcticus TaxID=702011 RepID=A0AAJ0DPB5_9PEZI|nr:hypothetical protein LTR09_004807 [Extremus antarcticus]
MSKVIPITSSAHFKSTLSSSTYTIVDFYADWCGPCKQISPIFEQLATAEHKPGKIVFCKVDVDNQKDVAGTYGVSAMPTFLILKGSSVVETVRGANVAALRTAVLSAAANAAKGPGKSSASFSGKGQALGSGDGPAAGSGRSVQAPSVDFGALLASPAAFSQGRGWASAVVSLEPGKAAEGSPFAVSVQQGRRVG